jgi:DNA-binding CsgD family transcriptional regulator
MSVYNFAPLAHASTHSIQVSFPPLSLKPERRRQPRRAEDCRQFALAELAKWFVNREMQPHFIVDEQMTVLLMNEAAKRFLASTKAISVNAAKLALGNDRHRAELNRVLDDNADQVSFTTRVAGLLTSVSIRRFPLSGAGGKALLITTSPASGTYYALMHAELGLTKAESEIALAIFKGLSLVKIAKERGASINTVKTQARYVFQKCRVHSQVGLTRRIGELISSK